MAMTETEQIQEAAEKLSASICAELQKLLVRAHVVTFEAVSRDYKAHAEKIAKLEATIERMQKETGQ